MLNETVSKLYCRGREFYFLDLFLFCFVYKIVAVKILNINGPSELPCTQLGHRRK